MARVEESRPVSRGVEASNALTARWIGSIADRPSNLALSGAAVWPLLAILASGATEPIKSELESALGLPSEDALGEAVRMLEDLGEGVTRAALGVWIRDSVPLDPQWLAGLPADQIIGRLTGEHGNDQAALDAWVRNKTMGILDGLPIEINETTLMLLVQAIALRTQWTRPFTPFPLRPSSGPWRELELPGLITGLEDLDRVRVLDTRLGPLTTFRAEGSGSVDVHLILGEDALSREEVLRQAIEELPTSGQGRRGSELPLGEAAPGLVVTEGLRDEDERDELVMQTARFDIVSTHDLLQIGEIVGLTAAGKLADFAGISAEPLIVASAVQSARAQFTEEGFEAAAATAFAVELGHAMHRHRVRVLEVTFDRPFGFLAIDRMSGLVLFAGWLEDPVA